MKHTALILMTVLMLAILNGDNVKPGLAQMADDCQSTGAYQISGASGRRACEDTAIEFWKWTAPATGPVTFDTRSSGRLLKMTVYTFNPYTEVVSALDEVRFTAQQGVEYTIFAQSSAEQTGTIVLNWRTSSSDGGNGSGSLASGDDFDSSVAISSSSGRSEGSNADANKESGEPNHADDSGGASVWWTWTAPASGTVMFDTRGSDFDTLLAVYTGDSLNRLAEVASNDNADEEEDQSALRFLAQQDQTYHVAVDGHNGETGAIVLTWRPAPVSETFIASVEASIPGPNGLTAVGRDVIWIAPAPEVDGLARGWHSKRNSNGDLHGLQINVGDTQIVVEQWLNGARQTRASYRDGKPSGAFNSFANGDRDGIQYHIYNGETDWFFTTHRDGTLHGPFGEYVDGESEGDFGTFSDGELEGMLHTIGEEDWSFETYEDGTHHGPYGTYNTDGQKDGPFGIYTDGLKNSGEVYWTDGEREPGTENRAPLPKPDNVPREITFSAESAAFGFTGWTPEGGYSRMYDSLNLSVNLFFWEPDGDTLEYFVSSLPSGIFHTTSGGKVPSASLELDESATPSTSGYAWLKACDPEGLCAEVEFNVFVQSEVTRKDPGEFTVNAPYCKQIENPPAPLHEVEICARDLMHEDGDSLHMTIRALRDNYRGPVTLSFPLSNTPTCKTVRLRGKIEYGGSVTYDFALDAQSMKGGLLHWPWWNWDTAQPLCEIFRTPDCFVGPKLWRHPGIEENRGALTVRTSIDTETHDWRYTPVTPTAISDRPVFISNGQITLITQERCVGSVEVDDDATTIDDGQTEIEALIAELEEARRAAEEAERLTRREDGTSTTDTTRRDGTSSVDDASLEYCTNVNKADCRCPCFRYHRWEECGLEQQSCYEYEPERGGPECQRSLECKEWSERNGY